MTNNDLYCKKCKSNHHPALDCVTKTVRDILEKVKSSGNYESQIFYSVDQALKELRELIPKKKKTKWGESTFYDGYNQAIDDINKAFGKE